MWHACSAPCGGGVQERHAIAFAGRDALNQCKRTEKRKCNEHACQPQDCVQEFAANWGECTMSCERRSANKELNLQGWQYKKTRVIMPAKDGGKPCEQAKKRPCNRHACTVSLSGEVRRACTSFSGTWSRNPDVLKAGECLRH